MRESAERLLLKAGLRPTSQRLGLAAVLFDGHDKHVTADDVMHLASNAGVDVSVATVYNTLGQLCAAGLLRRVTLDGGRTFFDTNISAHHHVFFEDDDRLMDLPGDSIQVTGLPDLGDGATIKSVDILVRVERR
ncbi:MAG: iron response transcriptional regulator IrrA [Caulobacterales bacterium]